MEMSAGDIVMEYNQAKYKDQKIDILADLNDTTADEIIRILKERGAIKPKNRIKSVRGGHGSAKKPVKSGTDEDEEPENRINAVQDEDGEIENTATARDTEVKKPESRIKSVQDRRGMPKAVADYIHDRIDELHALEAACRRIISQCTEEYGELREFMTAHGVEE